MIPKTKLFEMIEDYCLNNLNKPEKNEFETELKKDQELRDEVKFEQELQTAITEEDVLNLREKLGKTAKKYADIDEKASFDLLDDFADIQELTSTVPPEELLDYYDSLPKVHVYQHEIHSNENIHQFYKEQEQPELNEELFDDEFEELELEGLEEAILEKDILDLRDTLSKVSQTVQVQYTTEEIDNYINGELSGKKLEEFEEELEINSSLQREVQIHAELESALDEFDVTELRDKLSGLMETETSWNVSEKEIEEFIDGTLEGESLEEFKAELDLNTDLKAEVALRKNVDASVGEFDIMSLRNKLAQTRNEIESKETKSIVPDTKVQKLQWWKVGAAVIVLMFAFGGLLKNEISSTNQVYDNFYQSPEWSPQRSVLADLSYLEEANILFANGEYKKAISLYDEAISKSSEDYVYRFYKGASFQNLEKFEMAIPEYSKVIEHGDNMFIEEAEWFKSLCYIGMGEKKKAKEQLLAIIERKGFYEQDAKAVLRKIRYSFK
jgi:tetratricopeptide (TPR) repeat protein